MLPGGTLCVSHTFPPMREPRPMVIRPRTVAPRFATRDLLAGQPVQLSDGSEGVALGVGPDGALRVRCATGVREVRSAEVSVRPAAPGAPA